VKPGERLKKILLESLEPVGEKFEELDLGLIEQADEDEHSPRFESGVLDIQKMSGGFFSFTAIAGRKKLGKTLLAVRACIESAAPGPNGNWSVHYYYGENTAKRVRGLIKKTLGTLRSSEPPDWFYDNFRSSRFRAGATLEGLVHNAAHRIPPDAAKVLIAVDSVNRLARYARMDYLRALQRICEIAQTSSEESGGRIAWMVLSEMNHKGGMVGMDIEHSAACLLYMRKTKDPSKVKMALESRESESGDLGSLYRNWQECRFEAMDSSRPAGAKSRARAGQAELRLVSGGGLEDDVPW